MTYRVSDEDRERVAERLRRAAGDGRLTLDELDARLTDAFAARTYADLAPLVDDLPPEEGVDVPPRPASRMPPRREELLLSGNGSLRRKGRWVVPPRIRVERKHGSVILDFREAVLTSRQVEVDVATMHGSVELVLPDGASASVDSRHDWGSVRTTVPEITDSGGPHFAIKGWMKFGSLRIRYGFGHRYRARRRRDR
jgi:hypothetical protein